MKNTIKNKCGFTPLKINIRHFQTGFTLVELMIAVAIIGILVAVAVPNFISYRDKARIAKSTATVESMRAGMAAYAADSMANLFPADSVISDNDWGSLVAALNSNGCTLKGNAALQGFKSNFTYMTIDSDGDATADDYYFVFRTLGVPQEMTGSQVEVRPSGCEKQTYP